MERKGKNADDQQMEVSGFTGMMMTIFFAVLSLAFLFPISLVFMNAFKSKLHISDAPFRFPVAEAYVGLGNYTEEVRKMEFSMAFGRSLFITVCSVAVIVLLTSMTVWYIIRVKIKLYSVFHYVSVPIMIMPFQMVMFAISRMANDLCLNSIYGLMLLYLGFGTGQAVLLSCGLVRVIPLEIEEAAMTDGCSLVQTYSRMVFPMLRPIAVTITILNVMWIWNDCLLPSLVLPREEDTISMVTQNFKGGYGSIDMGATMAMLVLAIVSIIIFYLSCQKYIIKGVAAGIAKG